MKTSYICVSDTTNGTVTKYHPDGSAMIVAKALDGPTGMVLDNRGNLLYVANTNAGTIIKFDSSGNQFPFAQGLNKPMGLALDRFGNLYVANAGAGTIVKFASNGSQSDFATGLSLSNPYLCFDGNDALYATTTKTVEKFDSNGGHSPVFNGPNFVYGIAFDCRERMYLSLQNAGSIIPLPGSGRFASDDPLTFAPTGLAFDRRNGTLYAAFGKSIRKYHLDGCGTQFVSNLAAANYIAVCPGG